ncbi:hypothetical protein GJ496_011040, partial [Pomphorhynchus laevis]
FPLNDVYQAFTNPNVDTSLHPFSWGRPNIDLIKNFIHNKLKWNFDKIQSHLLLAIKKGSTLQKQTLLDKFVNQ